MPIRLDQITPDGRTEFAVIEAAEVVIGREPSGEGLAVNNSAVSREHGLIARHNNQWFYKDLGSTNGSWVNGQPVGANAWRLLRPGTSIQLADSVFVVAAVTQERRARLEGASLIVFSNGRYLQEYPVPEYGRALVIGGPQGDLEVEGELVDQAALAIERRGMDISAHAENDDLPAYRNGELLGRNAVLRDGDELMVAGYQVLVSDPPRMGTSMEDAGGRASEWANENGRQPDSHGYEREAKRTVPPAHSVFGRPQAEGETGIEETVSLDPEEAASKLGYDRHPSMRFSVEDIQKSNMAALEDRLIILILGILLLALMACMIWFIFL